VSDVFESERGFLRGLAYRMLGSVSEAEDIVQDAWLRWREVATADVQNPRAYLARIVTHLCLDQLDSARARREQYVGQWLPEPLVDAAPATDEPLAGLELAADLSFALLAVLERLSPLERAAFLLHDVFDLDFATVASTLARGEDACRQLASRARRQVREARPRYRVSPAAGARLCEAFLAAIQAGDIAALANTLAEDVVFRSDGGGVVAAVPRPLHGRARVAQVLLGFARQVVPGTVSVAAAWLNGEPGLLVRNSTGELVQTLILSAAADGRIGAIYVQRNPAKLAHLGPPRRD